MRKTLQIAWREFAATAFTKGFVIGVIMVPLMLLAIIAVIPLIVRDSAPVVEGRVAVIDRTGQVGAAIAARLDPERVRRDVRAMGEADAQVVREAAAAVAGPEAAERAEDFGRRRLGDAAEAQAPRLAVDLLPADADAIRERARVGTGSGPDERLALIVIPETALQVATEPDGRGPGFEYYIRPRLDDRVASRIIEPAVREAITDARIVAAGLDPARVRAIMSPVPARAQEVVQGEARRVATGAQFFVPFSFLMLLWIAVMTSGQYLLTTTIEEKSNRIMEVLLSAVSPMQLMVGKILGQMAVGLLILVMYSGLGLGALISFKLMQVLDPSNLGLLVVYFFIAYFLIAALMAAIGAAVTEIHEAQSLIGPVIMVLVIVMALSPALIRNPNGDLAVALSLIPPFSPFVMVIRIAGTEAVPAWQVAASMIIGFASVLGAAWAAAKVFRIGVLMYGKPPNLATLVRWIRMA